MNDLHPDVKEALDQIDAAIFTGDTFFNPENMEELKTFIGRWNREITKIENKKIS